jgi:hypothetical protein
MKYNFFFKVPELTNFDSVEEAFGAGRFLDAFILRTAGTSGTTKRSRGALRWAPTISPLVSPALDSSAALRVFAACVIFC